MITDSKLRFGNRVENYAKYRPQYPKEVLEFFKTRLNLNKEDVVADIGSGTGISSEIFLANGNSVYSVEPNENMRRQAEINLDGYAGFQSVNGTSEATGLLDNSCDFIVAAQAFHRFDPEKAKIEFMRILKSTGKVILIWNDRLTTETDFLRDYDSLICNFGTDYKKVNHKNINEDKIRFFLGSFEAFQFSNYQDLDFSGLLGRLASSSYAPNVDHPRYEEMKAALKNLFDRYNVNGVVRIEYSTLLYCSVKRPQCVKHFSELQEGPDSSYYTGSKEFLSRGSPLSKQFGLHKLGIHHELLPPGRRTSWPHAEENEEEFVHVLEGYPDAWIDGIIHRLGPGDSVGFPCGTGMSHTFINNTLKNVRLLVVGEASKKDSKIYYPLNPSRREQCVDSWWHQVPKQNLGHHDGLPDQLRGSESLGPINFIGEINPDDILDENLLNQIETYKIGWREIESSNKLISQSQIFRYCIDEKTLRELLPNFENSIRETGVSIHFESDLGNKGIAVFKGRNFEISKIRDSSWDPMLEFIKSYAT